MCQIDRYVVTYISKAKIIIHAVLFKPCNAAFPYKVADQLCLLTKSIFTCIWCVASVKFGPCVYRSTAMM